jgi:Flp pilus assembly protein TadG
MKKNLKTAFFKKSERGQSLIEMALTFTLLMTLLAGIVDLGIAFFGWIAIRDAAQEGAAFGAIEPLDGAGNLNVAEIEERVRGASPNAVIDLTDPGIVAVNVSLVGQACAGGGIRVDVTYTHDIVMPFIGAILGRQDIQVSTNVTDTILIPSCD